MNSQQILQTLQGMTPYKVLDAPETATDREVKIAYYAKARKLHPDKNGGGDSEQMKLLNWAYHLINTAEKRRAYEQNPTPYQGANSLQDEDDEMSNDVFAWIKTEYGEEYFENLQQRVVDKYLYNGMTEDEYELSQKWRFGAKMGAAIGFTLGIVGACFAPLTFGASIPIAYAIGLLIGLILSTTYFCSVMGAAAAVVAHKCRSKQIVQKSNIVEDDEINTNPSEKQVRTLNSAKFNQKDSAHGSSQQLKSHKAEAKRGFSFGKLFSNCFGTQNDNAQGDAVKVRLSKVTR